MAFSESEKQLLLSVKGVGPMVISRLEQMGFSSLAQLSEASYDEILISGAALTGSSCWKNSPQAKKAVEGAIATAKQASTPSSI
ncbi:MULTISPECIES: Pathogenicity locus [Providencia]|uniref:Pathogenicity locus n=1 Tax=Providencia TaxID=586 RepID=UPI000838278E|nr:MULTISPECIES: Pathogenicity locus [Providencia]MBP6121781.1 helix-hairpin-helix domain-containing protein [Providencia sp.]NIH21975.1 helix-hairpin-helix domain-containing protein [Providencia heimbachae]